MKKLVSILLALILALGLTVSAFAAGALPENEFDDATGQVTKTGDVKVTVNKSSAKVYYVTVEWSSLDFTYQEEDDGTWNPESHTYSDSKTAGWVESNDSNVSDTAEGNTITRANAVTVTNHSNAAVKVKAELATNQENKNTTVSQELKLTGAEGNALEKELETADTAERQGESNLDKADKAVYSLTLSGVPTEDQNTEGNYFGTITVTIGKVDSST